MTQSTILKFTLRDAELALARDGDREAALAFLRRLASGTDDEQGCSSPPAD